MYIWDTVLINQLLPFASSLLLFGRVLSGRPWFCAYLTTGNYLTNCQSGSILYELLTGVILYLVGRAPFRAGGNGKNTCINLCEGELKSSIWQSNLSFHDWERVEIKDFIRSGQPYFVIPHIWAVTVLKYKLSGYRKNLLSIKHYFYLFPLSAKARARL